MERSEKHTEQAGIFVPLSLVTIVATYLLIAVGALVRAAGAGLGCPDWPRCFGRWIPPTRADHLPAGFDASQFSTINTWLEYVNRLLGVVIGLLIFATLLSAWRRHRHHRHVLWPASAAFLLVGFQGWLGGQVVEQELDPNVLTLHLVVALLIVGLLLYTHLCARYSRTTVDGRRDGGEPSFDAIRGIRRLAWLVACLTLVQVTLGTRVRGVVQALEKTATPREDWLPLGWWPDLAHRQLAVVVTAAAAVLLWAVIRFAPDWRDVRTWASRVLGLTAVQIIAGLGLAYGGVPRALQVVHLSLSSLLIGAISIFLFLVYRPLSGQRS
ncbi:MAG: COX15/CtaA family protein [Proteobacteria bacterium]|nr:COX15/CtaA family protein [Pseudomonadota bacterium]